MRFLIFILLFVSIQIANAQTIAEQADQICPVLIGETVPDAVLKGMNGQELKLKNIVSQKPSLVIFYRGGWCPYCNLHLAELQAIESKVMAAGYQILAISPDSPESLQASVSKNKLNYNLLSDPGSTAAQAFGLAFKAPVRYSEMLEKASAGANKDLLPVPAVFIINTKGEILFEYINPDYKKRLKGELLLTLLSTLN
jgi:peroxiredoxin